MSDSSFMSDFTVKMSDFHLIMSDSQQIKNCPTVEVELPGSLLSCLSLYLSVY